MSDDSNKTFCTIDHTNKRGDGRDFDPYRFWLKQLKRREEIEAAAERNGDKRTVTRSKSRLT